MPHLVHDAQEILLNDSVQIARGDVESNMRIPHFDESCGLIDDMHAPELAVLLALPQIKQRERVSCRRELPFGLAESEQVNRNLKV